MTDPTDDPMYRAEIQQIHDILEELSSQVTAVETAQRTAARGGSRAATSQPAAPVVATWWRHRATDADWSELRAWVADFQKHSSTTRNSRIPPCWDRHPGLVEELAAVHQAWRNAMIAQAAGIRDDTGQPGGGSVESSMWFTQGLWPLLDRITGSRYMSTECSPGAHLDD